MELGYWIVRILQRYSSQKETSDTHPMTLAEIQQRVAEEYDGRKKHYKQYTKDDIPTRKMVQDAMKSLINWESLFPDEEKTIIYREYGNPDARRRTDYWYRSPWRDADLRFLIDSALYSGILNEEQTQELIKNIKKLSGENLEKMTRYAGFFGGSGYFVDNDVLDNVELLSSAIYQHKKVRFMLNVYNTKKELRPVKEHIISALLYLRIILRGTAINGTFPIVSIFNQSSRQNGNKSQCPTPFCHSRLSSTDGLRFSQSIHSKAGR